jgi:hypothetical protein
MRRGPSPGRSLKESEPAAGQQSNRAGLLSVGFSTRSIRMQGVCPPCNTSPLPPSPHSKETVRGLLSIGFSTKKPHLAPAIL